MPEGVPGPLAQLGYGDAWLDTLTAKRADEPADPETLAVYRAIWSAFVRWCVHRGLHTAAVTPDDLEAYLAHLEASQALQKPASGASAAEMEPSYLLRVLRVVERVLSHRARATGEEDNQAVAAVLARRRDLKYSESRRRRLERTVEHLTAGQEAVLKAAIAEPRTSGTWQEHRNLAMAACHLGAGLSPAEIRDMQLGDVRGLESMSATISVRANGTVPAHVAPMAEWAQRALARWIQQRTQSGTEGAHVFPGTRKGKQLSKSAHFDAIVAVLQASGIDGSAYDLRHTFAISQLHAGMAPHELAAVLGLSLEAIKKYDRVIGSRVRVR